MFRKPFAARPVSRATRSPFLAVVLTGLVFALTTVATADDTASIPLETVLDEEWRLLTSDGESAGGYHYLQTQVVREGAVLLLTDESTVIDTMHNGQPAQSRFDYHSEETVMGDRLMFALRMEVPGSPLKMIVAEVAGSELVITTSENEQSSESRVEWTPELAAGMAFQSRFSTFAWRLGDVMTVSVYNLMKGLTTSTFTGKGTAEIELADGSRRTLMHVERTDRFSDRTTQVVEYFLAAGEGVVVERRGGMSSERTSDTSLITNLFQAPAAVEPVAAEAVPAVSEAAPEAQVEDIVVALLDEFWAIAHVDDERIGRAHTTVQQINRGGEMLIVKAVDGLISTVRFGEPQSLAIRTGLERTLDGDVVRMTEWSQQNDLPPVFIEGIVAGGEFLITVTEGETVTEQSIPWTAELAEGMRFALQFEDRDWQPGETAETTEYSFATGVYTATYTNQGEVEMTLLDGATVTLLHIAKVETLADGTTGTTDYYIQPGVGAIRTVYDGQVTQDHVSAEVANEQSSELRETGTVIEVSLPTHIELDEFYYANEAVYMLTLEGLEAGDVMTDLRQRVTQVDGDTVKVRVSDHVFSTLESDAAEIEVCLAGGDYVDLSDPLLQQLAAEGIGSATTAHDMAIALELFVNEYVEANYAYPFDSASQVAANKAGDCSEHSVLLIALLRLNGIPARSAAGLVIDTATQTAMGHMWVEAYVDGGWMPLDATIGIGGILPAHIKFADWDLRENTGSSDGFVAATDIWRSPLQIEIRGVVMPE